VRNEYWERASPLIGAAALASGRVWFAGEIGSGFGNPMAFHLLTLDSPAKGKVSKISIRIQPL
jgi:hypothetical protein